MKRLVIFVLLTVAVLALVAQPAFGAYFAEKPQMHAAYLVWPFDGSWGEWTGIDGKVLWYEPGTPIPADHSVWLALTLSDPTREILAADLSVFLNSARITGSKGFVFNLSETEAAQYWSALYRDAHLRGWDSDWWAPVGHLAPGVYHATVREHLTTTVTYWDLDESGHWYSYEMDPYVHSYRFDFTVM